MATRTDAGAPIKLGSITLWPDKYCVAIDGTTKILTAVEFRLLYRLASQPYRTFTPEELYGDAPEEIDGGARKAIRHRVYTVRRGMGRCAGQ
jgi:DNA-binding response OmpR family regulator